MEKNIFSQEEIAHFLQANYVGIKVDVDANEGQHVLVSWLYSEAQCRVEAVQSR